MKPLIKLLLLFVFILPPNLWAASKSSAKGSTATLELLPQAIADMRSGDSNRRKRAFNVLTDFTRTGYSSREAELAVVEAAKPFPKLRSPEGDPAGALIEAAVKRPYAALVPLIEKRFADYNENARHYALEIILTINTEPSIESFFRILDHHSGQLQTIPLDSLTDHPRHARRIFPRLLKYARNSDLEFEIYALCLSWCQDGYLRSEDISTAVPQLLSRTRTLLAKVASMQDRIATHKAWDDAYMIPRAHLDLLTDLIGYVDTDSAVPLLRQVLELRDPRPKLFAAISLFRHKENVSDAHLESIAAAPLTRNTLYDQLGTLKKESRFPEKYFTQKAFAESDMVEWLAYPTELGHAPESIELMKVFSVEKDDTKYDYYLFRFRSKDNSEGKWLAGVAGPFDRAESPTTDGEGGTFSKFEEWDSKTPEQHIGEIAELLDKESE